MKLRFWSKDFLLFRAFSGKKVVTISAHKGFGLERIEGHPQLLTDHLQSVIKTIPHGTIKNGQWILNIHLISQKCSMACHTESSGTMV